MSTAQELDYTTLKWVKNEIDENLKQTRQALEAYVENPEDATQLRFCTTYLHQIYGTLQMVEIYGGALLAEEMEKVAQALVENQVRQKDDAYDVLMRAILQLPSYLEHLEQGEQDRPVILLPLLNDLRAARGDHLLSESAFFAPNLGVTTPIPLDQSPKSAVNLQAYAKKLRSVFQSSLVGLYRGETPKANLRKIGAVFKELLVHSHSEFAKRLWWVSSGVIEALFDGGLDANNHIKQLISQIDGEIKRLISDGDQAFEDKPPTELLKNLLYYVATAKSNGKRVAQIKTAFNLEQLIPGSDDISQAFANLRGSNQELMESVTGVIKEDLLQIKDQLDIFVRSKERHAEDLGPFAAQLNRISDTLAMLGLGDLHKIIQDQASNISEIIAKGEIPNEISLMEIASALLYIESSLEGIEPSDIAQPADENADSGNLLPPSEQKQLTKMVISETTDVLSRVKDNFNAYANDTDQWALIEETPGLLNQVKGVLAVLSLGHASKLLQVAINYIAEEMIEKRRSPNSVALDELADVITSIEYYLEAIIEMRAHPESILLVAEKSIEKLGYDVDQIEQIKPTEIVDVKPEAPVKIAAAIPEQVGEIETISTDRDNVSIELVPESSESSVSESETVDAAVVDKTASGQEQDIPAGITVQSMEVIDEEILEIFIEEADEIIVTMKENLDIWMSNPNDEEPIILLRRSYHTIKGSGRLAGANVIGEFAWGVENLLNRLIDKKIKTSPGIFSLLSDSDKALNELLKQLKGLEFEIPNVNELIARADALANGEQVATPVVAAPSQDASAGDPPTRDSKLVDIFKKETTVHIQSVRTYLSEFPENSTQQVSEPLMRALHTLHGSARVAKAEVISQLSEPLDRYFRTLYDAHLPIEQETVNLLRFCIDIFEPMAEQFDGVSEQIAPENLESLVEQIVSLHDVAKEVAADVAPDMSIAGVEGGGAGPDIELTSIFVDEAKEILGEIVHTIEKWQAAVNSEEVMEELQRALHTIKGGARMAKILIIADICEQMEETLAPHIEAKAATDSLVSLYEDCQIWLMKTVEGLALGEGEPANPDELLQQLKLAAKLEPSDTVAPESTHVEFTFEEEPEEEAYVTADEELLDIFLEEAAEILESSEGIVDQWLHDKDNHDYIAALQRDLHTLKGGARMANVGAIASVSHSVESVLEKIVEQKQPITDVTTQLIQAFQEWISQAINQVRHRDAVLPPPTQLLHSIENLLIATPDMGEETIEITFNPDEFPDLETAEIETIELSTTEPDITESETVAEEASEVFAVPEFMAEAKGSSSPDSDEDFDDDLLGVFLEEADEIQVAAEQTIHAWQNDYKNIEYITELQRSLHTLKGGARMAGITAIGDLSHAIESLLEAVVEEGLAPTEEFPRIVQQSHDWLSHAIEIVKQHGNIEPATTLTQQLDNLRCGKDINDGVSTQQVAPEPIAPAPEKVVEIVNLTDVVEGIGKTEAQHLQAVPKNSDEQIRVRADLVDNLVNHAGEANIYNARIGQQLNSWRFNLTELSQTVVRIHEQLRKFEIEAETQIMYRHSAETATGGNDDFDPLEMDRFSHMQQLSRGMVESLSDLSSIQNLLENSSSDADLLLLQQSRVNADLQESLMRTRLTPFSSIIARLRRVVRQTCQEIGKEANLNVEGAEGEMDRGQLNRIVPALEHILRNAVDHGIEMPDQRRTAGKSTDGKINITFSQEGSEIVIHIQDDGGGINLDALRKKAIERNLIKNNTKLPDKELMDFILESGFSTAKNVTQISGRGVGMDVVNNEIKLLNGSLHIDSVHGQSTTFNIRLPLTVLVNQALLVDINEVNYAIQLTNIEHIVRVNGTELNSLLSGEQESFHYAGNQYDHLPINRILHGVTPALVEEKSKLPVILVRSGDQRVALHVDQMLGRHEIVIKSIGPQLSSLANISGATILPDGKVALILDIASLIRTSHTMAQDDEEFPTAVVHIEKEVPKIMIVDDSITVRKVTDRVLKRHNFETITAKDGVDALTVMLEVIPDIMLLDVEMPRMDGFELASTMRNDERLRNIPIIMITSRTGAKHRDRALSLGVNMYMGKPYQEHDLLENINILLEEKEK